MSTNQTHYQVSGMKCGGCIARATEALKALPGFESAQFDLKSGTATVEGPVDPMAVAQALTAAGYPATPRAA